MPHKRAKRSVREQQRSQSGTDLAPTKSSQSSLQSEPVPKTIARILNAEQTREQWRQKQKRRQDDDGSDGRAQKKRRRDDGGDEKGGAPTKTRLKIKPGETIPHFNKRVEDDMRSTVREAAKASRATLRNAMKTSGNPNVSDSQKITDLKRQRGNKPADDDEDSPDPPPPKHDGRPKEFQTKQSSAPRRLNDIAQAPPEFKSLPRGASSKASQPSKKNPGVVSMAQKQMMDVERENAIQRYRQLRAGQRLEQRSSLNTDGGEQES